MTKPTVEILMATYFGSEFISNQLESIRSQTYEHWSLIISDDGSDELTLQIINNFIVQNPNKKISILSGPKQGFVANFMNLLQKADASYVCFCDQDDIWARDKLDRQLLRAPDPGKPVLVCGRTELINAGGHHIGFSPLRSTKPSFANSLVQSIAGGNTMLMTNAALSIVKKAIPFAGGTISHDWWVYQILSGVDAKIVYDAMPTVQYRQHGKNLVGHNNSIRTKFARLWALLDGTFSSWCDCNVNCLVAVSDILTKENQQKLNLFVQARKQRLIKRLILMRIVGVFRGSKIENIALWLAIALGKI